MFACRHAMRTGWAWGVDNEAGTTEASRRVAMKPEASLRFFFQTCLKWDTYSRWQTFYKSTFIISTNNWKLKLWARPLAAPCYIARFICGMLWALRASACLRLFPKPALWPQKRCSLNKLSLLMVGSHHSWPVTYHYRLSAIITYYQWLLYMFSHRNRWSVVAISSQLPL